MGFIFFVNKIYSPPIVNVHGLPHVHTVCLEIFSKAMHNAYSVSIEFHFVNIFFRNMSNTITDLLWKTLIVEINNVA